MRRRGVAWRPGRVFASLYTPRAVGVVRGLYREQLPVEVPYRGTSWAAAQGGSSISS